LEYPRRNNSLFDISLPETERSARRLAMNWTDRRVVEIVLRKVSGAPVIAHSRVRPEDSIANREEGPEWLAFV
jgi:hypothetical protein